MPIKDIPTGIIEHIKKAVRSRSSKTELNTYFSSGAKDRHIKLVRKYLGLKHNDNNATRAVIFQWALEAAKTKEALADIINVSLEYLVKEKYELPPFSVLQRLCQSARAEINNRYFDLLSNFLNSEGRAAVNKLLNASGPDSYG